MSKLKALLLTQGMHGMISQVEGLAKALNLKFRHETIKLKKIWDIVPPKFTPVSESILANRFVCDSKVVISCGRKSVIPSILLKRRFKKEIFTIHIQDPKVDLSNFDSISLQTLAARFFFRIFPIPEVRLGTLHLFL